MKKFLPIFVAGLVLVVILIPEKRSSTSQQQRQYVTIGTGGVTGLYFPAGGAICRLVNRNKYKHNIQCSVESTGGSVYNLNALATGEIDFGISQSDLIHQAYDEKGCSKGICYNPDLRTVVSFYTEPLTIVARKDAKVKELKDLQNKRINIGAPGSGQRATVLNLIKEMGWTEKSFKQISGLNPVEQATALCDNKLDAIIYSVGHPNGSIQEASSLCDTNLVSVSGPQIDNFLAKNDYYIPAEIPGKLYRGTPDEIKTFGVKVALLTSTKTPKKIVKELVTSLYNNFDSFKRVHPIFTNLTKESIFTEGIVAPLHAGVKEFLIELHNEEYSAKAVKEFLKERQDEHNSAK